jgi:hypothetical protein
VWNENAPASHTVPPMSVGEMNWLFAPPLLPPASRAGARPVVRARLRASSVTAPRGACPLVRAGLPPPRRAAPHPRQPRAGLASAARQAETKHGCCSVRNSDRHPPSVTRVSSLTRPRSALAQEALDVDPAGRTGADGSRQLIGVLVVPEILHVTVIDFGSIMYSLWASGAQSPEVRYGRAAMRTRV